MSQDQDSNKTPRELASEALKSVRVANSYNASSGGFYSVYTTSNDIDDSNNHGGAGGSGTAKAGYCMVDDKLHFVVSEDDQKWIDACNKETFNMIKKIEDEAKEIYRAPYYKAPYHYITIDDEKRWKRLNIWLFGCGLAILVALGVLAFLAW